MNRNLRVFINGILQLEYYDQLDAQSILGMPTALSYLGITASTGALTNDNLLTNWVVQKVMPTSSSFKVVLDPSTPSVITTGDNIYINIYMYDRCNNRYVPFFENGLDSENFVSMLKFNNNCALMAINRGLAYTFFEKGPAFQAMVSCLAIGTKTIQMTYKDESIGDSINVNIFPGSLWAAEIQFPDTNRGNVDAPFSFIVRPLDRGHNLATTTADLLKTKINLIWNGIDNIKVLYTVMALADKTFNYTVDCEMSGPYAILSSLFIYAAGNQYDFNIETGQPEMNKSIGKIYTKEFISLDSVSFVAAGTEAILSVHFYDKNGNTPQITQSSYQVFLSVLGLSAEIPNGGMLDPKNNVYNTSFKFTKKGFNKVLPQYISKNVNCPYCQVSVTAGSSSFENADLFVSDSTADIKYSANKNGSIYTITKPQTMSFLLVLKDLYGNTLDSVDAATFAATLSGNNMKAFNLSLTAYSIGAQVTIPQESLYYFQTLVGRGGYWLNITEKTGTKKMRSFSLTIVSDGSDNDADNGDYNYMTTSYYWIVSPVGGISAVAGIKYKLAIQLNTFSGKRYNQWIAEDQVVFNISPLKTAQISTPNETIYPVQKGPKTGVYTVEFVLYVGGSLIRTSSIFIATKKTIKSPIFKSIASDPTILLVDNNSLKSAGVLNDGIVLSTYQFLCHLTDNYTNPARVANPSLLNLLVKNEQWSFMPVCVEQTLGNYACKFSPQVYGTYGVSSSFFAKSYNLSVIHGEPSSLNSNAGIENNLTEKLIAGITIIFRITPKDGSASALTQSESIDDVKKFSLSLKNPDSSLQAIVFGSTNVIENGDIITKTIVTKSGQYSFLPTLNGESIMCEICAFEVNYDAVDSKKTKVFMLVNQDRKEIITTQTLQIDNTKIIPLFYMQFYDQYSNQRPVSSDLSKFTAVLTVPGSQASSYNFTGSELRGDYQFVLPGSKYESFQFELGNDQCSILFSATNQKGTNYNINVNYSQVILAGSSNDSSYTNKVPNADSVKIIPNSLELVAGEFATINVELRAANGRLYRDLTNLGWYSEANLPNSFNLMLGSNEIQSPTIIKGKQYGTYSISFKSKLANYIAENLTVSYLSTTSTTDFIPATQKVPTLVNPASFKYLVNQDTNDIQIADCKADTKKQLTFFAFDIYENMIKNVDTTALGLKLKNTNPLDTIIPIISFNYAGLITLSMPCKKAGTVTLTSVSFRDKTLGTDISSYKFTIVPGDPDAVHSLASLTKTSINAGSFVNWTIMVSDIYDNPITISLNNPAHALTQFNATDSHNVDSEFLKEETLVSHDGNTLFWTVNLTIAGTHAFKAFYNNLQISSTANQIQVKPLDAFFTNSILAKMSSKTGSFEEYSDSIFLQDVLENPQFKVNFYDLYRNLVDAPTWSLQVYLDGPEQNLSYSRRVQFCSDSNVIYSICETNENDQKDLEKSPKIRYSILVPNLAYMMNLKNLDAQSEKEFNINITGLNGDNSTKNLPVDPANTLIVPTTTLQTVAGESTRFIIELRTTLANYRRNEWFVNPMSSLQLKFKYNQSTIQYAIVQGDITDRYYVTIAANETHSINDPNQITVVIEHTAFVGYQPKWIVTPAKIASIIPVVLQNTVITALSDIVQNQTVDDLYTAYFLAKDRFENPVALVDGVINVYVSGKTSGAVVFGKEFLSNGLLKISFQPKKADNYSISFGNDLPNSYQTTLKQGAIDIASSYGNLKYNSFDINSSIKAGSIVQVVVYPYDQWGNPIILDEALAKDAYVKYYYNRPGVQGYIVGESPSKIIDSSLKLQFDVNVTIKGNYLYKVSIHDQEIRMILGMIKVTPAEANLASSLVKYMNDESNQYVPMDKVIPVKEDNAVEYPSYVLILADIYGNLFDEFLENPADFSVILTGNAFLTKPLSYESTKIVGNALAITVPNASLQYYRDGLGNSAPYSFKITWKRDSGDETTIYPIILYGQGIDNDKDAEINTDENLANTWVSKTSLNFMAGAVENYLIEIRTSNGKRKADFTKQISFQFTYLNGSELKTGNFNASYVNATLRGRFLVTVYGELANNRKFTFVLKMFVTNNEIPATLNITVTPNKLDHVKLDSDMTEGTADLDYVFYITPYDMYNNIADVIENDINLKIVFPSSSSGATFPSSYSTSKDPSSGMIQYIVKSRIAGYYQIQSSLLVGDLTPKFLVVPGVVSIVTSKAEVLPNTGSIKAGDKIVVNIIPVDAFYNKIEAGADLLSNFSLSLSQGEYKALVSLSIDTTNHNLQASFTYTQAGIINLGPQLTGSALQCDACLVKVTPGDLDIKQTKFFSFNMGDTYNETKLIKTLYGSKSVVFTAQLYDKYGNQMQGLEEKATFELNMEGNDMDLLTFNLESDKVNALSFSLDSNKAENFSRLVPRDNYTLELTYIFQTTKDSISINLQIVGDDDGAGNGDFVAKDVLLDPQSIRIPAGQKGYIAITLRQKSLLRYNGNFDLSLFKVNEIDFSDKSKILEILNYTFYNGNQNGVFYLEITGTQAFQGSDKKNIFLTINSILIRNPAVEVIIDPDYPLANNTVIISPNPSFLPTDVEANKRKDIIFQLYDKHNNLFARSDLAAKLYAKIANDGDARFEEAYLNDTTINEILENGTVVSTQNNSYIISMFPKYPPRILQIQVFYAADQHSSYPISNWPFTYIVHTVISYQNTDITGANLNGVAIGQNLTFSILVKDTEGFCFEEPQTVNFRITGPYLNNNIEDKTLTAEIFSKNYSTSPKAASDSTVNSSGYVCKRFYQAFVPGNVIQKIGFYQIDAFIVGQNSDQPVKSIRETYMTPGPINPINSLITVPSLYNRGSNPLELMVNTLMSVQLILRDHYKNIINQNISLEESQYFSFEINGISSGSDYEKNVTYLPNATFKIDLMVKKTGVLGKISGSLMGTPFTIDSLDKTDYPSSIEILAGPCSVRNPEVDYINKAVAGVKQLLTIGCRDEFNNTVYKGGAQFKLKITGIVDVIGIDVVNANIKDLKDGKYSVDYTFTWSGNYSVLIFLDNLQYMELFHINVVNSLCDVSQPYNCLEGSKNQGECFSSYRECGFDFLDACPDDKNPISCKRDGVTQCVNASHLCDCGDEFTKCPSDDKCVDAYSSDGLCATLAFANNCQGEFSHQCPDFSCRANENECPAPIGCPPGTKVCADQTCVESTKQCPTFTACANSFKCDDQSCVNDISDCPTRITCTNYGWIICPDKTCAETELSCKLPNECSTDNDGNKLFMCPDQSCRKTQNDCPKPVTCSFGFALCEDWSCRKECTVTQQISRRRVLSEKIGSKLFRLLANSTDTVTNASTSKCPNITCPGGECCDNMYKCPSVEACPSGYVKCSDLSCATNQKQCLVQVCPQGKYHCWDGNCVDKIEECATRTTCPPSYPVKCSDGSCTDVLENCNEFIECPPYKPYHCANGECRGKNTECPTSITCPLTRPILCSDNTCQKNKDQCNDAVLNTRCSSDKVRCADGSCAYSKDLCPTAQSCNPGQIRCWDNTCADDLATCPSLEIYSEVCSMTAPLRCPDGSCRANLNDCPTQIICPLDRPVKCDDGTCKQSNSLCALNTQCPAGVKRCPDGSCAQNQKCGTPITCSEQAPFLCYDNTCKIDPRDCPVMPICSDLAKILCPDGSCVSQRILCTGFTACEDDKDNKDKSVRCPDLFCYSSRKNCSMFMGCPGSRVLCDDGSCAKTGNDCPSLKCPIHLPYKCSDGFCVSNLKFCDNNATGCPYNKPLKCADGTCITNLNQCANNNTVVCPIGEVNCSDGSCAKSIERCPNALGCSTETPFMCGNGLCINPNKTSCPVLNCPANTPIKCLNGLCAQTITACSSFIPLEDYAQCAADINGNNVPCADGRCVASADLCKPLLPCDSNSVRCKDNTCRPIQALCPLTTSACPVNKAYRCESGACAQTSLGCPTIMGCPANFPWKCEKTGTCVKENTDCEDTYKKTILLGGKCKINVPYLCSDGNCYLNSSSCPKKNDCPDVNASNKCIDGSCVANKSHCPKTSACKGFLCPDFKCVQDSSQCITKNGCPVSKPFKCADGRCVSTPFSLYGNTSENCVPIVVCPKYRPYLCGDGECQGHPSLCRAQQNCAVGKPYRCPDQTCVSTEELCQNSSKLCPQTSPFMCQDGTCVSQAIECQTSNNLFCSDETPFSCASGQCVKYPAQCVSDDIRNGKMVSSRILADGNVTINFSIDPGCANDAPHRCYDGTCRSNVLDCPLSNGCSDMGAPYKCLTGLCVATAEKCISLDLPLGTCANNLTRCEDGYCRFKCPNYNGCPNILPLLCPNGFCARSLSECAGDSACPLLNLPYRCVDNTCVYTRTSCTTPKRNYQAENVHITVSPISTTTIDFIQAGENSQIRYGQLIIPAGAILTPVNNNTATNVSNDTTQLFSFVISPVPESIFRNVTNPIDRSQKIYSSILFPYTDGTLEYHQTVRSPLVKIQTLNRETVPYRFPIVLYLTSDIMQNSTRNSDYCMGQLNLATNQWECHSRALVEQEYDSDKMGYPVSEDGIYSVIFNPTPNPTVDQGEPCGFFCEYKMTLLYVLISLVVFSVVFTYLVWRISRYVSKYRVAKKQMDNYREQISELEQAQTDVQGQTIKDKIEGISFTTNPAFKEQSSGNFIYLL